MVMNDFIERPLFSDYEKEYFTFTQRVSDDGGIGDGKIDWNLYTPDIDLNINYLKATEFVSIYQLLYKDEYMSRRLGSGYMYERELLL